MEYEKHLNGFLHRHPGIERELGLDDNHVIVDRQHWEDIVKHLKQEAQRDAEYLNQLSYPR